VTGGRDTANTVKAFGTVLAFEPVSKNRALQARDASRTVEEKRVIPFFGATDGLADGPHRFPGEFLISWNGIASGGVT
jgi:hypothetical protein